MIGPRIQSRAGEPGDAGLAFSLGANVQTSDAREYTELDGLLVGLTRGSRLLPALVPLNAASERARLVLSLERGGSLEPRWSFPESAPSPMLFTALARARALASRLRQDLLREAYLERFEELELDLFILDALADPHDKRRARALGRRRFGSGQTVVEGRVLRTVADAWLAEIGQPREEPRTIAAEGPGSLAEMMRRAARAAGLGLSVFVEPRLAAAAATAERTVFLADRHFGANESRRLIAHEVLGHAVAAENGRRWPIALFGAGTADSFTDQEGLALVLEEEAGAFDAERRRTLALRVLAADWVHDGATFGDIAQRLVRDHGLTGASAVAITERSCRGSGVARDVAYLAGYLRARAALDRSEVTVDQLRAGRISLRMASRLPRLFALGLVARPLPSAPDLGVVLAQAGVPLSA